MPTTSRILTGKATGSGNGPSKTETLPVLPEIEKKDKENPDSNVIYVDFVKNRFSRGTSAKVLAASEADVAVKYSDRFSLEYASAHEKQSRAFLQSMRPFFLSDILKALHDVQPFAGTPSAAMYIDQIIEAKIKMENTLYEDTILEVLRALYDALVYKDKWTEYSAEQYQKALDIIEPLSNLFPISQGEIDRAILALKVHGFDTTPYPLGEDE